MDEDTIQAIDSIASSIDSLATSLINLPELIEAISRLEMAIIDNTNKSI